MLFCKLKHSAVSFRGCTIMAKCSAVLVSMMEKVWEMSWLLNEQHCTEAGSLLPPGGYSILLIVVRKWLQLDVVESLATIKPVWPRSAHSLAPSSEVGVRWKFDESRFDVVFVHVASMRCLSVWVWVCVRERDRQTENVWCWWSWVLFRMQQRWKTNNLSGWFASANIAESIPS